MSNSIQLDSRSAVWETFLKWTLEKTGKLRDYSNLQWWSASYISNNSGTMRWIVGTFSASNNSVAILMGFKAMCIPLADLYSRGLRTLDLHSGCVCVWEMSECLLQLQIWLHSHQNCSSELGLPRLATGRECPWYCTRPLVLVCSAPTCGPAHQHSDTSGELVWSQCDLQTVWTGQWPPGPGCDTSTSGPPKNPQQVWRSFYC